MKRHLLLAAVGLLSGCGSPPAPKDGNATRASLEAVPSPRSINPKLLAIKYPKCEKAWAGNKLSKCGRNVFEKSMAACDSLAREALSGSHPARIDEYMGDSWIDQAGASAAESVEDRERDLRKDPTADYLEPIAFAKGDGTNNVRSFFCSMDQQMHLDEMP